MFACISEVPAEIKTHYISNSDAQPEIKPVSSRLTISTIVWKGAAGSRRARSPGGPFVAAYKIRTPLSNAESGCVSPIRKVLRKPKAISGVVRALSSSFSFAACRVCGRWWVSDETSDQKQQANRQTRLARATARWGG